MDAEDFGVELDVYEKEEYLESEGSDYGEGKEDAAKTSGERTVECTMRVAGEGSNGVWRTTVLSGKGS